MTNKWRGEGRQAKLDGAKLVPNSGRGAQKGDATWGKFLIDYKHNTKSFTLSKKAWLKHSADSWDSDQREPAIVAVLDDEVAVAIVEWALLRQDQSLIDELKAKVAELSDELDSLRGKNKKEKEERKELEGQLSLLEDEVFELMRGEGL